MSLYRSVRCIWRTGIPWQTGFGRQPKIHIISTIKHKGQEHQVGAIGRSRERSHRVSPGPTSNFLNSEYFRMDKMAKREIQAVRQAESSQVPTLTRCDQQFHAHTTRHDEKKLTHQSLHLPFCLHCHYLSFVFHVKRC